MPRVEPKTKQEETPFDPETAFQRMLQHSILTKDQEYELIALAQTGDESAKQKLVSSNMKLIAHIAKGFKTKSEDDRQDLISEGVVGFYKGLKKFQTKYNVRLNTFVGYDIWQAMNMSLKNQGKTVRIPAHIQELKNKIDDLENGNTTDKDIAATLGTTTEEVTLARQATGAKFLSIHGNTDGDGNLPIYLEDKSAHDIPTVVVNKDEIDSVLTAINGLVQRGTLDQTDKDILFMFFGVGGEKLTLDKITEVLAERNNTEPVTRERVRQRKERALAQIRDSFQIP